MAERKYDRQMKGFTLDQGSQFFNSLFKAYCEERGIILHDSEAYTPEENGVAERSNKTINNKARTLLAESNLPQKFWYAAIETAVFMDNRTISKQYGSFLKTPYELWFRHKPNIKRLQTFGCAVQIVIRKSQRGGKFEEITNDGILVGFQTQP